MIPPEGKLSVTIYTEQITGRTREKHKCLNAVEDKGRAQHHIRVDDNKTTLYMC